MAIAHCYVPHGCGACEKLIYYAKGRFFMSEKKKYATVEEAINDLLESENKANALNLAAYLNENNMPPNMANWGKVQ
jgi:hypothetical protein